MDERTPGPRRSHTELSLCVLRHVTKTSRAVVAAWDRALEPAGLTGLQFNILATVAACGDLNVHSLARIVGMDASTVPRAIAPLVRERWLQVRPGRDARERIIRLTSRGRAKFARAKRSWQAIQRQVVNAFGKSEWESLVTQLEHLRGAVRLRAGR